MLQQALHLGRWCFRRLVLPSAVGLLALGCGPGIRERTVSDIRLDETSPSELDTDEALEGLATAAPRKILWIERERDVYDANLVARDLERIERFYQSRGYYDVKVVAARVRSVGEREVEIEVHVTPGPRVSVRKVEYDPPLSTLPTDIGAIVAGLTTLKAGDAFEEQALDRQKRELEIALTEAGYAYAKVKVTATVNLNARAADVVTRVEPGRRARFGEIRISGLRQIPEDKVRAAMRLRTGATYSQAEQHDAREALGALQLFSQIEITPDLSNPEVEDVPVIVTLQEDKLRKLTLGGGTQLDSLKLEVHARTGWEHKNFFGGARRFSVDGTLGVDLFPTRFQNFDTLTTWTNTFLVMQTTALLEQPSIFGGRTKGSAQAKFSRRPVLYSLPEGTDPRAEVVIGYHTPSGKLALERHWMRQRLYLEPSYNLEARLPFAYQNQIPPGLETVWVSYPRLFAMFQTLPGDIIAGDRDAHDLTLSFRNSVEIAGLKLSGTRYFGGSLSDLKVEPEVRAFVPLWGKRWHDEQRAANFALATRVKLGFLLLPDYGGSLRTGLATTQEEISGDAALSDQQKLLSRAFYSGGPTSNRGYAYRAISPHGPVGFLLPTRVNCVLNATDPSCTRPLGGFTLWEASLELRFAGFYPITLVAFLDASDVTRDVAGIGFKYPHLSAGPGVRYESPVGPIRLDIGIRLPGLQAIGERELPLSHGQERPDDFPGAIQLAFGDAF